MNKSKRAIMLISVLFITVLVLMFVGAAIGLAPSSLMRTRSDIALSAAGRAGLTGIDWVRSRISTQPLWNASVAQTFQGSNHFIREGDGQVTGWIRDNRSWSRFRIRFNYQDGSANPSAQSDDMDDPTTAWSNFPYVSCNNLLGATDKLAPLAGSGGQYYSQSPWPTTQLRVPANCLLISVEGSHGGSVREANGVPVDFTGTYHKRTRQTLLKLNSNQPITAAAVMAAGNLNITALGSPVQLNASNNETARLRTKGALSVLGGVQSTRGELNYGTTQSVQGTVASGVTVQQDDSSGFYQLPLNKVRSPVSPITLQAGTYVVTSAGTVNYVNLNYTNYATTSPLPTGNPVTLPAGMTLVGPNTAPAPKYRLEITKDVQITASGGLTDFALVPDGGAPQSRAYGGVTATAQLQQQQQQPVVTSSEYVNYWFGGSNPYGPTGVPPLTQQGYQAWMDWAGTLPVQGAGPTRGGVPYTRYTYAPGCQIELPDYFPGGTHYPYQGSYNYVNNHDLTTALNNAGGNYFANLQAAIPVPTTPANGGNNGGNTPPPAPTPTGLLPKDIELSLQGGSAGLTFQNDGKITIGSQIKATGGSIVSRGSDIALIGTSNDFSSSPGSQMALSLYAKGNIVIDSYKLDPSGATFGGIKLQGVVYAWNSIDIFVGLQNQGAPFQMAGALVAYGGDPSGAPQLGTASATIQAQSVDLRYDPTYLAGLAASGPFSLSVLTSHQF